MMEIRNILIYALSVLFQTRDKENIWGLRILNCFKPKKNYLKTLHIHYDKFVFPFISIGFFPTK